MVLFKDTKFADVGCWVPRCRSLEDFPCECVSHSFSNEFVDVDFLFSCPRYEMAKHNETVI